MRRYILGLIILVLVALGIHQYTELFGLVRSHRGELILYGNIDVRQVNLGFRVHGRVASMLFQEGDPVKAGDLMAWLDPQPYQDQKDQSAARVESVKAASNNATKLYERRVLLRKSDSVSQEDYDDAESNHFQQLANLAEAIANLGTATTNLDDTHLYAPSDGFILTRIQEPGAVVRESDPIYTLTVKSPVWVRAYVNEPNLGRIAPGMSAIVQTDSGKREYQARIGFISPVAEFTPKTVETTSLRTDLVYRLRLYIDEADEWLRQGMPVTVRLKLDQGQQIPIQPSVAMIEDNESE